MNARELLKECRAALLRGQADEQMAMVAGIDAYLAAPSESAMEMVRKIRDIRVQETATSYKIHWQLAPTDAAALIEGLQRRVPRKFVEELFVEELWDWQWEDDDEMTAKINKIAAKHSVVIE